MQVLIKLMPETPVRIPFSYYSDMAAAIYKAISDSDLDFASSLHDGEEHRSRIKLFGFSPLHSPQTEVHKSDKENNIEGAFVFKGITSFIICSPWPELVNRLGEGLLKNGYLRIGSQLLKVIDATVLPPPVFKDKMLWNPAKAVSIVTSWSRKTDKNKIYAFPDKPADGQACELLLKTNILHKWRRLCEIRGDIAESWAGCGKNDILSTLSEGSVAVRVQSGSDNTMPYRTKLHYIKGNPVRSWVSPVEVLAPVFLQRLIWSSALGEMNSMGYGVVQEAK
ncbi:MAG TPA: hypothetical protein DET40_04935 [Lentisphaeria bacterium]|nr:MAG: hypothetical protein A2X45_13510 [Lentisphaerae bacterium GWF2_50_93]HCE42871.1 hypothetical protein [Lentisphaeria bacterium]